MSEAIVVAIISLVGVIVTAAVQTKRLGEDFEKRSALADAEMDKKISVYAAATDAKIDTLGAEVRAHNEFAKRVPLLELRMDNVEKSVESIKGK